MNGFFSMFQQVTGVLYAGLVVNVLLAASAMPLVVVAFATDMAYTWHVVVLLTPLMAPGLVASFAVFRALSARSDRGVLRTFWAAYRRSFRKAVIVGATTTAGMFILIVDAQVPWSQQIGALAIPMIFVAAAVLAVVSLHVLVALAAEPEAKLRLAWRAALFLGVRRWYLAFVSLMAVFMLATFASTQPVLALGLATAPVLYIVWANSTFALQPVLPESQPVPA